MIPVRLHAHPKITPLHWQGFQGLAAGSSDLEPASVHLQPSPPVIQNQETRQDKRPLFWPLVDFYNKHFVKQLMVTGQPSIIVSTTHVSLFYSRGLLNYNTFTSA